MYTLLRIDTNILAAVFLFQVLLIASKRLDRKESFNRLFLLLSLAILSALCLETATCLINRRPEAWLMQVSTVLHIILYILSPFIPLLWLFYNIRLLKDRQKIGGAARLALAAPAFVNILFVVSSPFTGSTFRIDASNVYHRGPLLYYTFAISYFYMLSVLAVIIINRKRMLRRELLSNILICLLPILGGAVQVFVYGPLFIWSSTALTLVLEYIFLQETMVQLDGLTGVWNRASFRYYIERRLCRNPNERFGLIYFDLDGLKKINDGFGHAEGDFALRKAVELVRGSVEKDNIIARLGGDEFAVITGGASAEGLAVRIEKIQEAFSLYNKASGKEYSLICSFGADIYDPAKYDDIDGFLRHVDLLMYAEKHSQPEILQ